MKISHFFLWLFLSISWSYSTAQKNNLYLERFKVQKDIDFYWLYESPTQFDNKDKTEVKLKTYSSWFDYASIKEGFVNEIDENDTWIAKDSVSTSSFFVNLKINSVEVYYDKNIYYDGPTYKFRVYYDVVISDFQGDTLHHEEQAELINSYDEDATLNSNFESDDFYVEKNEREKDQISFQESIGQQLSNQLINTCEKLQIDSTKTQTVINLSSKDTNTNGIAINNNTIAVSSGDFFLSGLYLNNGYFLTDARIFRNSTSTKHAYPTNNDTAEIELVRVNKVYDLALVKLKSDTTYTSTPIHMSDNYNVLDKVHSYGTTGELYYFNTLSKGNVSGKAKIRGKNYFLIDSPSHIAFTGAGVFNENKDLIGISLLSNYDYKANIIMPCLEANQIEKILNIKL